MGKIKIRITVTGSQKIKNLKRLSRATVGLPKPGKKIIPKKGGPYQRRTKHRKFLDLE